MPLELQQTTISYMEEIKSLRNENQRLRELLNLYYGILDAEYADLHERDESEENINGTS